MPKITSVEFREFSARHHNATRNWLIVKLNTDDPKVFGLGDASPMGGDEERIKSLITGIEATGRELDKVFGLNGITRIAATGLPLDPNQHQAMLEVPSAEAEPGTVLQELQAGYMIKDRLLRPAMVAVAKKPE